MSGDGQKSITILHISDMQFGLHHEFGKRFQIADGSMDLLKHRLCGDLRLMREEFDIRPDVVAVTGDLAEWGLKIEFDQAKDLLVAIAEETGLSRERFLIVPGNHDINRKLCQSYFLTCEGDGESPIWPAAQKWRPFDAFIADFYGNRQVFPPERPWSLIEIPELKTVFACLNSTMAEGHLEEPTGDPKEIEKEVISRGGRYGNYGWCGENQYDWFAKALKPIEEREWLRIALIHHNLSPESRYIDKEYLRDAADFERILGDHVNLVLHGHTHVADARRLGGLQQKAQVPVMPTGSAGLKVDQRFNETPIQYQFIRVSADRVERFGREYSRAGKKFKGDTLIGGGNDWRTTSPLTPLKVRQTFEEPSLQSKILHDLRFQHLQYEDNDEARLARGGGRLWPQQTDFLSTVEQLCELRFAGDRPPQIRRVTAGEFDYLEVIHCSGVLLETVLVGANMRPDLGAVDQFKTKALGTYRSFNPGTRAFLVAGNTEPTSALVAHARNLGIELLNYSQFSNLLDFKEFLVRQSKLIIGDGRYVGKTYVTQRIVDERSKEEHPDAYAWVKDVLLSPESAFLLVMGDFGTGKSFLLKELARRIPDKNAFLTPFLLEMRDLEKTRTFDELIAQQFARRGETRIDLDKFRHMLEAGRVVLLADGFDELAVRVTYDTAADHLQALIEAVRGKAKIVVTSRTHHFRSTDEVTTALAERLKSCPDKRIAIIQPFNIDEVREFLRKRFSEPGAAQEWFTLILSVNDLGKLAATPRMLSFIVDIPKDDLLDAAKKSGQITAAELYRLLVSRWLEYEALKTGKQKGVTALTPEQVRSAVTELALVLWQKTDPIASVTELTGAMSEIMAKLNIEQADAAAGAWQMGVGSLLIRQGEGQFSFLHQSILEWLVAEHTAKALQEGRKPEILEKQKMSALMADFLWGLAGKDVAAEWAKAALMGEDTSVAAANAQMAIDRLRISGHTVHVATVNLTGRSLRGQNLTSIIVPGAVFEDVDATETVAVGVHARYTKWRGARLVRANFSRANLLGADLSNADLTEANLMLADLRSAKLGTANFRRAKLTGAAIDEPEQIQGFGCARPGDLIPELATSTFSAVRSVCFSPEADLVASGHDDATVRIWDAQSGREIKTLKGHENRVTSVAFAPDGKTLASGSYDRTVRIWDAQSGREIKTLKGHENRVLSVAFAPDGKTLASGSYDRTVRIWDAQSGREIKTLKGHENWVYSVAFAPDGKTLASGSYDRTVRIWDAQSGSQIKTLKGHEDRVFSVAFAPDGKTLASGSYDRTVRIWDAQSGSQIKTLKGHEDRVFSVAFAPDGKTLASGSYDKTVRIWDAQSGSQIKTLKGHEYSVLSVAFAPDGKTLASGSSDKTVRIWEAQSGREIKTLKGHENWVSSVAFAPDGKTLASGSYDNTVRVWDARSGREIKTLKGHESSVTSVAFAPDGKTLASGSYDKTVRIWEAQSGREIKTLKGHESSVTSVAFAPDGKTLASGSYDKTVRIWDAQSGREIKTLKGHESSVTSVAFAPDGKTLASGSYDNTVRVWDARSGREIKTLKGHENWVSSVAFAPDGKTLASGSYDRTVRIWDAQSGREIKTLKGHEDMVCSVAFAPDGKTLASGSYDRTVRIWDAQSGREIKTLKGHEDMVCSVAFAPDGKTLASGSDDRTVRIWEVETGAHLATLLATSSGWAAFRPDGSYKMEGDPGGAFWYSIALCRFEPGELDELIPGLRIPIDEPLWLPSPF